MTLIRRLINRIVIGAPFEHLARCIYTRLNPARGVQYEREILHIMRRCLQRNSNCIDIGAYRGGVLHEMIALAPKGEHYAFEPVPRQYQYLVKSFPNVHVYQLALGDIVQETPFYHVISRPTYSGLKKVLYPAANERVEVIKVQTQLLDNIIPPELPVHFIKVDVEGAEFHVFRGGMQTIKRNRPIIVFEHGLTSQLYYGIPSADAYDLLTEECGLHISLMKHWLKRGNHLSHQDFIAEVSQKHTYYFIAHT